MNLIKKVKKFILHKGGGSALVVCCSTLSKGYATANIARHTATCHVGNCGHIRISLQMLYLQTVQLQLRALSFKARSMKSQLPNASFNFYYIYLCAYVHMHAHITEYDTVHTGKSEDNLWESVLSLSLHMGPWNLSKVIRLDGKNLYPLSQLTNSPKVISGAVLFHNGPQFVALTYLEEIWTNMCFPYVGHLLTKIRFPFTNIQLGEPMNLFINKSMSVPQMAFSLQNPTPSWMLASWKRHHPVLLSVNLLLLCKVSSVYIQRSLVAE